MYRIQEEPALADYRAFIRVKSYTTCVIDERAVVDGRVRIYHRQNGKAENVKNVLRKIQYRQVHS